MLTCREKYNIEETAINYVLATHPNEEPVVRRIDEECRIVYVGGNNQNYRIEIDESLNIIECIVY